MAVLGPALSPWGRGARRQGPATWQLSGSAKLSGSESEALLKESTLEKSLFTSGKVFSLKTEITGPESRLSSQFHLVLE